MVVLNLTIAVEVLLFLVFLWAMRTFVFKPLLAVMDKRDIQIEQDKETASTETAQAEALEHEYQTKAAEIHRESSHKAAQTQRAAQDAHNDKVIALRRREQEELAVLWAEAMRQVESERKQYPALTAELATLMAARLGLHEEDT